MTPERDDLIERLSEISNDEDLGPGTSDVRAALREAATALAEKYARIAELGKSRDRWSEIAAARAGEADRATSQLTASRAECEGLRAERDEARKKLSACHWYWPEDDTSSETCADSAQEVVQNAYDWSSKMAGEVVPVARGGIVEVTYCASLPPDGDADSDDDFWVKETTAAAAQAKIDAELARRAATRTTGGDNGE